MLVVVVVVLLSSPESLLDGLIRSPIIPNTPVLNPAAHVKITLSFGDMIPTVMVTTTQNTNSAESHMTIGSIRFT